jgi:hypothetical protein
MNSFNFIKDTVKLLLSNPKTNLGTNTYIRYYRETNQLSRVGLFEVVNATIPHVYLALNGPNNTLIVGGVTYTISLGTYTPAQIATAIKTVLDTDAGSVVSTITETSEYYIISSSSVKSISGKVLREIGSAATTTSSIVVIKDLAEVYVFNSGNLELELGIGDPEVKETITLNEGNYSIYDIVTEMNDQITAFGGDFAKLSVFYGKENAVSIINPIFHRLTFKLSSAVQLNIYGASSSGGKVLGVPFDVSISSGSYSYGAPLIAGPNTVYIQSKVIKKLRSGQLIFNGANSDIIDAIPVNETFGKVIKYDAVDRIPIYFGNVNGFKLTSPIYFRLVDSDKRLVDLNGSVWHLTIMFTLF